MDLIDKRTAKSYMTFNNFLVVIIIMSILFAGIFFFNQYRQIKKKNSVESKNKLVPNECPDYWDIVRQITTKDGRGNIITCKNTHRLGVCALEPERNEFTFDDELFLNPSSRDIAKCKWAKQCQVSWSGIDNKCSS